MSRKILITGSSGGIGKAISKKLVLSDNTVIFTSSSQDKLDLLKNNFGNNHYYYLLDLSRINNLSNNLVGKLYKPILLKKLNNEFGFLYSDVSIWLLLWEFVS